MKLRSGKVTGDVLLNFLAALIPIIVLQLIIYPRVAAGVDADKYGLMITIYSFMSMISLSLGNVVNNIRLINLKEYENNKIVGDYNFIILFFVIVNAAIIIVGTIYYEPQIDILSIILILLASTFLLLDEYLEVAFRIELNYKRILENRMCLTIGYLIGFILFFMTSRWEYIFLFGQIGSFVFIISHTLLLREPFVKTKLFKKVSRDIIFLLGASIVGNAMSYADKLLLYPLLGGRQVAIYYTAAIIGKMVSMAITPITGVMLSYISHKNYVSKEIFHRVIFIGVLVSVIGYIVCIVITKPILMILYPQWMEVAMKYVPLTTLAVVISAFCSLINPFVMKFCNMYWQTVISLISTGMYLASSIVLLHFFGLMGFCCGTVLGYMVKLGISIFVYYKHNKNFVS